jgi:hypothetical protein
VQYAGLLLPQPASATSPTTAMQTTRARDLAMRRCARLALMLTATNGKP